MSLQWTALSADPVSMGYRSSAGTYTVCRIGMATGWTYEAWCGGQQLAVGLRTYQQAQAVCERHRATRAQVDSEGTP